MTKRPLALISALMLLPGLASAHTGHTDAGWMAALLHPVTGTDHLLALLAVGLLASRQAPGTRYWLPATAVAGILAGLLLPSPAVHLPWMELAIAGSVVLTGVLLARRNAKLSWPVMAGTGVFFVFHGMAHANELTAADPIDLIAGLSTGSIALLFAAMAIGVRMPSPLLRLAGTATALSGLLMLST